MSVINSEDSHKRAKSFVRALFDLSFASFITLKLIRFLYMLSMLLGLLAALIVIVTAFNINSGLGVVAVFFSPLVFLLVLVWARVSLELIAIVFRIEENTAGTLSRV